MTTVEFVTKPVPATVTAVAVVVPASAEAGLNDVRPGTGFVTLNDTVLELPPFGGGLITRICTVPAVAMSAARTSVVNEVASENKVGRLLPFTATTDWDTKFLPL